MHHSPFRFFVQSSIALGSMLGIGSLFILQDPPSPPSEPLPALSPSTPPVDLENDPVFQEIKKAFMPRESSPSPSQEPSNQTTTLLPDAQWHAVEHLLRAARELESVEQDHIENGHSDRASKTRSSIQQIRSTARALLAE
jgi:hypothetical protein